jgi:hypothetical protein
MIKRRLVSLGFLMGAAFVFSGGITTANAQEAPAATPAPMPMALPVPGMAGPLAANAKPTSFDAGPLGTVYVNGVASGMFQWQDAIFPGDKESQVDLTNGQIFISKTDGLLQFFVEVGAYSIPDLGLPYIRANSAVGAFWGAMPQAFIKIVPSDSFSILVGKLPTLIGAEYTFSFENVNIQRGLLWNQENAVNRGVQVNYTAGPLSLAVSWNDGLYSNQFSWIWGSLAYTIDGSNSFSIIASGNTAHTNTSTLATPLALNNEQLYNIIYTYTDGPLTIQPYIQYTYVPKIASVGLLHSSSTTGAAIFVKYAITDTFTLAGRVEYITSTGSVANGAPSLIYGPGSNAWSFTLTPTYQQGIYFIRGEYSYVGANKTTPGFAMGPSLNDTTENRLLVETGVIF